MRAGRRRFFRRACGARKPLWLLALLLCGALFTGAPCGAADRSPLDARIDLDLDGADLGAAAQQLTLRSDADFLVWPDVARPEEFGRHRLHLQLRNATVRRCADWVARALGARYRVVRGGRTVIFTSSYEWLDEVTPEHRFYDLGGIAAWEERDAFLPVARELVRVYALKEPAYSLRMQASDKRLHAILAPELHERLQKALRAMANPGRVPAPARADPALAAARASLERPVRVACDGWTLPELLSDLAFQADRNIGFDHTLLRERELPRLRLSLGMVPLREALAAICDKAGFAGWMLDPPDGIWLHREDHPTEATATRELLWEGLPVVGYAARGAAERLGADALAARARLAIPPDLRSDPSVTVA
ncbi:MAG: hypothetical protein ACOCX4_09595, partial [Planctomycetota bacterium]